MIISLAVVQRYRSFLSLASNFFARCNSFPKDFRELYQCSAQIRKPYICYHYSSLPRYYGQRHIQDILLTKFRPGAFILWHHYRERQENSFEEGNYIWIALYLHFSSHPRSSLHVSYICKGGNTRAPLEAN